MCGITGIYAHNTLGRLFMINLVRATAAISSRGPDFQGVYNDEMAGLGHRRLSVIDPSPSGNQPMKDKSGRYILVYNGEIYNQIITKQTEAIRRTVSFRIGYGSAVAPVDTGRYRLSG